MSSAQVSRPPRLIPGFEVLPPQDDRRLSGIRPRLRFVRPISSLAILSTELAAGSLLLQSISKAIDIADIAR